MRWAFWRRTNKQPVAEQPLEATSCWPAPAPDDPDDEPRRPAFSGTRPAAPADLVPGTPRHPLEQALPAAAVGHARAAVRELVSLAADRDAASATVLLERLDDELAGAAARVALAALGPRLATLAGHAGEDVPPGSGSWRETVLQGDVTADRAERIRRAVAGQLPDDLLRFAVRFACGTPDADPALARHAAAAPGDLLLAAAVVLAQTVEDGADSVDALAGELAQLLPDRSATQERDDEA